MEPHVQKEYISCILGLTLVGGCGGGEECATLNTKSLSKYRFLFFKHEKISYSCKITTECSTKLYRVCWITTESCASYRKLACGLCISLPLLIQSFCSQILGRPLLRCKKALISKLYLGVFCIHYSCLLND